MIKDLERIFNKKVIISNKQLDSILDYFVTMIRTFNSITESKELSFDVVD